MIGTEIKDMFTEALIFAVLFTGIRAIITPIAEKSLDMVVNRIENMIQVHFRKNKTS